MTVQMVYGYERGDCISHMARLTGATSANQGKLVSHGTKRTNIQVKLFDMLFRDHSKSSRVRHVSSSDRHKTLVRVTNRT